jgi:hypothetical protein
MKESTKKRIMRESTKKRILEICRVVDEHYQPERRDRCIRQVWRMHIEPKYGIKLITLYGFLKKREKGIVKEDPKEIDRQQFTLW